MTRNLNTNVCRSLGPRMFPASNTTTLFVVRYVVRGLFTSIMNAKVICCRLRQNMVICSKGRGESACGICGGAHLGFIWICRTIEGSRRNLRFFGVPSASRTDSLQNTCQMCCRFGLSVSHFG